MSTTSNYQDNSKKIKKHYTWLERQDFYIRLSKWVNLPDKNNKLLETIQSTSFLKFDKSIELIHQLLIDRANMFGLLHEKLNGISLYTLTQEYQLQDKEKYLVATGSPYIQRLELILDGIGLDSIIRKRIQFELYISKLLSNNFFRLQQIINLRILEKLFQDDLDFSILNIPLEVSDKELENYQNY